MTGFHNILQVSTDDGSGGAERIALNLKQALEACGYRAYMAVGARRHNYQDCCLIPNLEMAGAWQKTGRCLTELLDRWGRAGIRGAWTLADLTRFLSEPRRWLDQKRGREVFAFPGSWRLLTLPPEAPDVVHLHNLHGNYFDLRLLPTLSAAVPTFLTLHDAWMLTGHCAHSFSCQRWRSGCGQCPDLGIYPAIARDATAFNWQRKKEIYSRSRLHVATPSRWLMSQVEASMLQPALVDAKVIANGIDLSVFHPYDKLSARRELGLPESGNILLIAAAPGMRQNIFKDYQCLHDATVTVSRQMGQEKPLLIVLGEEEPGETDEVITRYVKFQEPAKVARYFQAADLYLHAAKADTFPSVVLEALACGTPVVATAVGGIPEQVKSLAYDAETAGDHGSGTATGILVPPGAAGSMARAALYLLKDPELLSQLGRNAVCDAADRFDLLKQTALYLDWYEQGRLRWLQSNNSGPQLQNHG